MAAITNPSTLAELWLEERERWYFQAFYYARYRFAFPRKTIIDFLHDVWIARLDPNDISDFVIDNLPRVTHWFERYFSGYHDERGYPVFTKPLPWRKKVLSAFSAGKPLTTGLSAEPHLEDIVEAMHYAVENGWDRFADIRLFLARLRGDYISCQYFTDSALVTVLSFHLLANERAFRVRKIQAHFQRHPAETVEALKQRVSEGAFDRCDHEDGFALTGTSHGMLFGFPHDQKFSEFEWNPKNTRLFGFDLECVDGFNKQPFRLVKNAHDLEKIEGIFQRAEAIDDLPNVA